MVSFGSRDAGREVEGLAPVALAIVGPPSFADAGLTVGSGAPMKLGAPGAGGDAGVCTISPSAGFDQSRASGDPEIGSRRTVIDSGEVAGADSFGVWFAARSRQPSAGGASLDEDPKSPEIAKKPSTPAVSMHPPSTHCESAGFLATSRPCRDFRSRREERCSRGCWVSSCAASGGAISSAGDCSVVSGPAAPKLRFCEAGGAEPPSAGNRNSTGARRTRAGAESFE
jgi:hypothetical protein